MHVSFILACALLGQSPTPQVPPKTTMNGITAPAYGATQMGFTPALTAYGGYFSQSQQSYSYGYTAATTACPGGVCGPVVSPQAACTTGACATQGNYKVKSKTKVRFGRRYR